MISRTTIKQVLADSIMELMKVHTLEKITVQMITENCNTTRQTFYYHFEDKFQLVNWIFRTKIDDITSMSSPDVPWSQVLGNMLNSMKQNESFYINALSYEGQNSFQKYITEYTRIAYTNELLKRISKHELTESLIFSIEFNSYGATGMIQSWIKRKMDMDPFKMAMIIADNMPESMKVFFSDRRKQNQSFD